MDDTIPYGGPIAVWQLTPGDKVKNGEHEATFIKSTRHPLYKNMRLVIWRLWDGTISLDALLSVQEVGMRRLSNADLRETWLKEALSGR